MKILSADKIREADAYTIEHEPIKSIDLMERAALTCFNWIYDQAPQLFPKSLAGESEWVFHVVCGKGNNGGDGLAIARHLLKNGYNVIVSVVHFSDKESSDFMKNMDRLGKAKKDVIHVKKKSDFPTFPSDSIVIDALFGTGLNRPVTGIAREVIEAMNDSTAIIISIDLPSGLFDCDNTANDQRGIVHSDHILTFQVPRLAFFLADNAAVVGRTHILDIGLHPDFMDSVTSDYNYLTEDEAAAMRQRRGEFSHKGTYGHALIIGGSTGMWGAPIVSATACLRAGAGLVSVAVAKNGTALVHGALPEVMVVANEGENSITTLPDLAPYGAIGIGPGLGKSDQAAAVLKLLIQNATLPLVIDADALNILSENPTWMAFLPKNSILTPHPGEFARLSGEKSSHFQSMEKQREMSQKFGIFILLKGAHSSLSFPDGRILINSTGNPGMATAGMGDALTGIITALLSSGYPPLNAAALAMFVHGRAGDIALQKQSVESLIASDLITNLGKAFESLKYVL